jgi:nitroreductase
MNQSGLAFLLSRASCAALKAPAPGLVALDHILQAGLRVPDHGNLKPLEFIVAQGSGLDRLGSMLADTAASEQLDAAAIQKAREMPGRAPMIILVVAKVQEHPKVPVFEQHLTAGCAVMAMQMAAQAQGFGGIWRSGPLMYARKLHDLLGLAEQDQLVGFLYLGTPATQMAAPVLPDPQAFVRYL